MNIVRLSVTLTLLLSAGLASAQNAARQSYIVQLVDDPVASYTGKVQGYAATKPAPGQKLNTRASSVQAYIGYLNNRQNAVMASVGSLAVTHRYGMAFNGFAAQLTGAEVSKLQANPGVLAITADTPRTLDTSRTPAFLGLTTPGGLHTTGITGENIIIGVIDGGITPEHPSFSDKVNAGGQPVPSHQPGTVVYNPITNTRPWAGACNAGLGFPTTACNNKLIGARYFSAGFDSSGQTRQAIEFLSPRDADGHGSHVAATAAGNAGVNSAVNGFATGVISGMAPRARIAAYKACWLANGSSLRSCLPSDSVAAIDSAVADGVDVINFSIAGTKNNYLDAVEVALLFASDAGVFVAASAGNDGPANQVGHMSPWLATVAASTHDRLGVANVTLGNGQSFSGPSAQPTGLSARPLILSTDAGVTPFASLSATQQAALRFCFSSADLADPSLLGVAAGPAAALDPEKVRGKIVVCDRGTNNRVNKSLATKDAEGVGMILLNTAANTLNDDAHFVPTVHLSHLDRTAIRTYAVAITASSSFSPATQAPGVVAPQMAAFSSRGPSLANSNILKPDIAAPGVNILAAVAPPQANAALIGAQISSGNYPAPAYDFLQGTSMASPHIAGMAALLKQARPTWSPAAIKSALMTTATGLKLADGSDDPDRFGYGAGHANATAAAQVKLVYDAGFPDYGGFLCGLGLLNPTGSTCNAFGFITPWNLNLPSLTSEVVGRQTIQRTVTNAGLSATTFTASTAIPGYTTSVSPPSLTLAPGARGSFNLTAQRTTAPLGSWVFGNLDWSDGSQTIRSPLTLKALALSAPVQIDDARVRANKVFSVAIGYNGVLRANTTGLVPATRVAGVVSIGGQSCSNVLVPAGAQRLRVALFDAETTGQGSDDLDLDVFMGAALVGSSGGASSSELVNISNPVAGQYSLCVKGFSTSRPAATTFNYVLSYWIVAAGNGITNSLRVSTPSAVTSGGTGSVTLLWAVAAGQRYFGTVQYTDGANVQVGQTALYIDNQAPVPIPSVNSSKEMLKALSALAR